MKYIISYEHLSEKQFTQDKAIADIKQYCTSNQFNILQTIAMESNNYFRLSFACAFVGINGYPVIALWNDTRQTMRDMSN